MIPNWMTRITETAIGIAVILGLGTGWGSLAAIQMAANITLNILDVPTSGRWTHAMPIMLFCLTDAGWELWRRVVPGAGPRPEVSRGNRLVWWLRWLV